MKFLTVFFVLTSSFLANAKQLMHIESGLFDHNGYQLMLSEIEANGSQFYFNEKGNVNSLSFIDIEGDLIDDVKMREMFEQATKNNDAPAHLVEKSLSGLMGAFATKTKNTMYTMTNVAWMADPSLWDSTKLPFTLNYSKISNTFIDKEIINDTQLTGTSKREGWENYLKAFSYLHEIAHASVSSTETNSKNVKILNLLKKKSNRIAGEFKKSMLLKSEVYADLKALNTVFNQMLHDGLNHHDVQKLAQAISDIRVTEHGHSHYTDFAIKAFTYLFTSTHLAGSSVDAKVLTNKIISLTPSGVIYKTAIERDVIAKDMVASLQGKHPTWPFVVKMVKPAFLDEAKFNDAEATKLTHQAFYVGADNGWLPNAVYKVSHDTKTDRLLINLENIDSEKKALLMSEFNGVTERLGELNYIEINMPTGNRKSLNSLFQIGTLLSNQEIAPLPVGQI